MHDDLLDNKSDKVMFYEMWGEVKSIKDMALRHSQDRKEEVAIIFKKLDSIEKKQTEDKTEIIDRIHSVEKASISDTNTIKGKLAAYYALISLFVSGLMTWTLEHFFNKNN